jgi:hypothetical protein
MHVHRHSARDRDVRSSLGEPVCLELLDLVFIDSGDGHDLASGETLLIDSDGNAILNRRRRAIYAVHVGLIPSV